jgi:FkbM family methyltransferase
MIDLAAWRAAKAAHVLLGAWHLHRLPRNAPAPVLLDVGARGGAQHKWRMLARVARLQLQLVEPDAAEAARLRRRHPKARVIQCALGAEDGEAAFHANRDPGLSSLLEPSSAAAGTTEATIKIPVRRFDSLCAEGHATPADFVKVDVQGGELAVLKGMEKALQSTVGLELES